MPDENIIKQAFHYEPESMMFNSSGKHDWLQFGSDFVFNVDEKAQIKKYVAGIKEAKIKQERKMRQELDLRIMGLKANERDFQSFGKALIDRIRFYIRAYYGRLRR